MTGVQTCALDRKSTRLNSSHTIISYAVFCLKKKRHKVKAWAAEVEGVVWVGDSPRIVDAPKIFAPGWEPPCHPLLPLNYIFSSFFFNDAAPPEIYPLSLHDALPT